MRILRLKGKDEKTILNQISREYGDKAIVLNTQKEEIESRFKWFRKPKTVITVALKDEEDDVLGTQEILDNDSLQPKKMVSKETQESYEMLLSLKNQISDMQETLKQMGTKVENDSNMGSTELSREESKDGLLTILNDKLINMGIKEELLPTILKGIDSQMKIEDVVKCLCGNIEQFLAPHMILQELPQVVFFIGCTGVGKTTTIAKLTAQYVLEKGKKVVLFTSDTYRIAAIEQLKTYADILGVQIEIIYDASELPRLLEKWKDVDHIFIDTAGRSHKNLEQVEELVTLLDVEEEKEVFLVVNANTTPKDITKITATYEGRGVIFDLILTKLDETDEVGNVINIVHCSHKNIAYVTNGQNVPADITSFDAEAYTLDLLGRINYE